MKKRYYFLAFMIPCIMMILLYMTVGVIFGDKNILTVDLANQYIEFFGALKDILSNKIGIFYSFSKTLGGNLYGLITYYLISPFNLLIVFFNKIDLPKFVLLINILKVAFSGLTSYIYFSKKFKQEKTSLMFSIIYSLMSYNIVYSQNIMWLDGVYLLPLIFLGIDKLFDKKPLLFYISLTISIVCNYYIGYMSCIAALIYYIYELSLRKKICFKEIFYCIKYIMLCVISSSFILIPTIFSLMQGKANGMLGDLVPNQRFAIFDLISRFFIGTFKNGDLLGTLPNIYISVMWISLVFYYFYNKNVTKKEKTSALYLILAFGIGFLFSPINTIWHTLKNPVGFPFRYSFMFDFILLIISFKSILKIKEIDKDFIKKFIIYGIIITLITDKLLYNNNSFYKIVGTLLLALIYLYYFSKRKKQNISTLIILLVTSEMFLNSFMIVYNIKYQLKNKYTDFVKETGEIIDTIKNNDTDFYRIEKDYFYSSNDELLLNYSGISHFSSVYESQTNEFLKNLGIFNRFYITNYNGSTLVTNSLFNIKYLLSQNTNKYYDLISKTNDINIYENKYVLPLGFMVDKKVLDTKIEDNKPFVNQNNILKSMNNSISDVFSKNDFEIELNNVKIDQDSKELTYIKINDNYKASIKIKVNKLDKGILYGYIYGKDFRNIDLLVNGKSIIDVKDENNYRYNVFELDSDEIEIVLLDYKFTPSIIEFYTLNVEKFSKAITLLKENNLNVLEHTSDYIKANIDVENDGILYTSIPYDEGFDIYVDGKEVKAYKIYDALTGIELTKGKHSLELKYAPRGLNFGIMLSIFGILGYIITSYFDKKHS